MQSMIKKQKPKRQLHSIILHLDYDCFYASVVEHQTPSLKHVPLAIQQKQIIVTCNYEARRRGLHKLQLVSEAKRLCPDLIIVLGEDISPFRDKSKELYAFFRSFSWNARCERLGFDEVFLDVSDMVDYNLGTLNANDLHHSFFHLSRNDATIGFAFDASRLAGYAHPPEKEKETDISLPDSLALRLILASHLSQHLRTKLEWEKGFTATAGISTNKLLSKLVGSLHKPNGQTTLLPPYTSTDDQPFDNVTEFIDGHDVGQIPGIGFKMAQQIRSHILQRPAKIDDGLVYGGTKENVLVRDVRACAGMGAEALENILRGPGMPNGIGARIWALLNGCDSSQVAQARDVPRQISLEDSYLRLDTRAAVVKELHMLAKNLIQRMHVDLVEDAEDAPAACRRWRAYPGTLRLTTRPRPARDPDGSRNRSFARISRSVAMPTFVFNLRNSIDETAERLVNESLLPLFRRLHPEKAGWNLSLINVAATNMADAASEKGGMGRDISKMFQSQDENLKPQKAITEGVPSTSVARNPEDVVEESVMPLLLKESSLGSEDLRTASQDRDVVLEDQWESDEGEMSDAGTHRCERCGATMPVFALGAHDRWHIHKGKSRRFS